MVRLALDLRVNNAVRGKMGGVGEKRFRKWATVLLKNQKAELEKDIAKGWLERLGKQKEKMIHGK